jgi:hypothetical protein
MVDQALGAQRGEVPPWQAPGHGRNGGRVGGRNDGAEQGSHRPRQA